MTKAQQVLPKLTDALNRGKWEEAYALQGILLSSAKEIERFIEDKKGKGMKLDYRYTVFKNSDLRKHPRAQEVRDIAREISDARHHEGKPPLHGVFIEHDWPEFSPTVELLAARVDGNAHCKKNELQNALAIGFVAGVLGSIAIFILREFLR
jgi:hypothetical protein